MMHVTKLVTYRQTAVLTLAGVRIELALGPIMVFRFMVGQAHRRSPARKSVHRNHRSSADRGRSGPSRAGINSAVPSRAPYTRKDGDHGWIDNLRGLIAVTAMLVCYALEKRGSWFILAFAGSCVLAAIYGFLQGAWPFGLVEAVSSVVAVRRWSAAISAH